MAASTEENDYVHRLMSATREKDPDCAFCICQVDFLRVLSYIRFSLKTKW